MPADEIAATGPAPVSQQDHKRAFFRQSGWLMVASVASGFFSLGVHFLAKYIPKDEYSAYGTLLAATMCIPAMPLQMVFAQQTAAALAARRERQLAGMIRLAWIGTFCLCVAGAVALAFFQKDIAARWHLSHAGGLWATLAAILFTFWLPIFLGLMQGQQNFFWYGWDMMTNGIGRVGLAALFVFALGAYAAGMMSAVAIGLGVAVAIGIWQTRGLWLGRAEPFDWRKLLGQILPLMFGFGAYQFLFASDTMFVRAYLPGKSEYYVAAGTLSRALVWLVGPLTTVMFPKIVHSTVRAEKSNVMVLTLLCTALLAGMGVVGLWIVGPWVVPMIWGQDYARVTTEVLPWYAGAMVPLTLGSVLVNNLLAKSEFRIVPVLVALAVAYGVTLTYIHSSLVAVLQTLGAYNLGLLVICVWFTWGAKSSKPPTMARTT